MKGVGEADGVGPRACVCVSVSICKTEEENHREIKGPLVESRR